MFTDRGGLLVEPDRGGLLVEPDRGGLLVEPSCSYVVFHKEGVIITRWQNVQ